MNFSNVISTNIPKDVVEDIVESVKEIDQKLSGLITLSREERDALPQIGDDTAPFVFKVLKDAEERPDLAPPGIDLREIKKDAELIQTITTILEPLKDLVKKLEDSKLQAGSEAYVPSLFLHNMMKIASRANVGRHHKGLLRREAAKPAKVKEMIA